MGCTALSVTAVWGQSPADSVEYADVHRYGDQEYQPVDSAKDGEGYSDSQDDAAGYNDDDDFFPSIHRPEYTTDGKYRQPVDIEFIDQSLAIVPTKLSGELFGFHAATLKVECLYHDPARRWGKLVRLDDERFAVIDGAASCVVVFKRNVLEIDSKATESSEIEDERAGSQWHVVAELPCPGAPNSLAWSVNDQRLYVSGQWSQRLYCFEPAGNALLTPSPSPRSGARGAEGRDVIAGEQAAGADVGQDWKNVGVVDLPMCGGVILPLPKHGVVLVMDAFGRDFAFVNAKSFQVSKHAKIYGHNVSDIMAIDDERQVLFTHQLLNETSQSIRGDITWGGLLSNNLRWLQVDRMLEEDGAEIYSKSRFYPVGLTGDGLGDPTAVRISTSTQTIAVTLGGSDRVAIANLSDMDFRKVEVGYRPVLVVSRQTTNTWSSSTSSAIACRSSTWKVWRWSM
ncbi:MAG: hypothetical protein R3C53_26355 [Pirellulaceae bacterium]